MAAANAVLLYEFNADPLGMSEIWFHRSIARQRDRKAAERPGLTKSIYTPMSGTINPRLPCSFGAELGA